MTFSDRDGWIWLDGNWLPWRNAQVHLATHTLHYGLGCFEGIRCYQGPQGVNLFRLDDHLARLEDSAKVLGLNLPFDRATLGEVCQESVRRNGLTDGYLRPLVFLGDERLGINPAGIRVRVAVLGWPWGAYLGPQALENGVSVRVSSWARLHPNTHPCRAKAIAAYTNAILAAREARDDGFDEAILLDTDGFVAEGPGENVFIVKRGELIEPELTVALDGITRRTIHALAADLGLTVRAARLTRDDLYIADEVFFCGTAVELTPVVTVDRRPVGNGQRGPLTASLQKRFFACMRGEITARSEWLTRCGPDSPGQIWRDNPLASKA